MTYSILHETLINNLNNLGPLIDLYQNHDIDFVPKTVNWLKAFEESLSRCRSPLSSVIAAERGKILSVMDGYQDPQLAPGNKHSFRKTQMATTSIVLVKIQEVLQREIQNIDLKFDSWKEKMSQFIAVASTKSPVLLPPGEPLDQWLQSVWLNLKPKDETLSMYEYLNSVMSMTDRTYILHDVMQNILSNYGYSI